MIDQAVIDASVSALGDESLEMVATGISLSVFLQLVPMELIERTARGFKMFNDFMGCKSVIGLRDYLCSELDDGE